LESYKVPLTRSEIKKLEIHQDAQSLIYEASGIIIMGDQEEKKNEIPNE
jgi:hypothetical protein